MMLHLCCHRSGSWFTEQEWTNYSPKTLIQSFSVCEDTKGSNFFGLFFFHVLLILRCLHQKKCLKPLKC